MSTSLYTQYKDSLNLDFSDTSFSLLMQKRIHKVLLIASSYDAFMIEEDGRIDEQIFNEYVSLNLRYPPIFVMANSAEEAFEKMRNDQIDLVITMLTIGSYDTFGLANEIKRQYPGKPIVVLTPFSREVSMRIQHEDLSGIDYVFSWLGNADLLLAIIKLIEDKMNADYDVEVVGVQTILLVENSIRYISSYLPNIYKIIFKQSKEYVREALNEHQRMLRKRGRPKILLATTYEEAVELFEKYKYNLMGVISDMRYKRNGIKDKYAGLKLCEKVKSFDEFIPFLLQSSDRKNESLARKHNAGFLHKYAKSLTIELKNYIINHFAFGEFVFKDPKTMEPIGRAYDLQTLQEMILKIPDESLEYHAGRNDFSKWLNARAIFPIAQLFKYLKISDFNSLEEVRNYILKAISSYRTNKGRGIIAKFDRNTFDEYLLFSRIGESSIGGKARGLAFANSIMKKHQLFEKYPGVLLTIPRTVVLSTDIFDEFMEGNELYKIALSDRSDQEILDHFMEARLPSRIYQDLYTFASVINNPIAVRSSSKLEDSHYQPFAGVYNTYMVPHVDDNTKMIQLLSQAIKSVYASVYFQNSKAYMSATSNVIDEEKMGIILQEVCGSKYNDKFYPTMSGVARSINFYPVEPEKSNEGIVNLAFGLGKQIVDGGVSLRFSPKHPNKIIQLSTPEMALRDTQKHFYALDLRPENFVPSTDEGVNLLRLRIREAEKDESLKHATSTYDFQNNMIREGTIYKGKKIITFANVLKHKIVPLDEILQTLLDIFENEIGNPIEIEFAVDLNVRKDEPIIFNFLQIRPIVDTDQENNFDLEEIDVNETLIYSEAALGNGKIDDLYDIIYVVPKKFSSLKSKEIAEELGKLNDQFREEGKNYVLVGPGRWGTADHTLGIPVKWGQISRARVIVESGLDKYRIDPSQGTHFFHNLTSFRIGYFTVNPYIGEGHYDSGYLETCDAHYENEYIRHIRFKSPIKVQIDGKHSKGAIFKPNHS